jgi:nucleoside-diphosphate-sugar epimerase
MKNLLVTGATGFIGGHLLPLLHQQGWKITAAVRNDFPQPPSVPVRVTSIGEIDSRTDWTQALEGVDTVLHLAALAHILPNQMAKPEAEFFRINTDGTANLVKQSIKAGVKHFILISTIVAITSSSDQILTEDSCCQPDTPYGQSKLQAEQSLIDCANNSQMTWTILRPALVYGSGNPGNLELLMKLVNRGLPLPIGSVKNRRSLIFVGNLVDAIVTCLNHPSAVNQIFLVSDSEALSTPQLVREIARTIQRSCYLLSIPPSLLKVAGYLGDTLQYLTKRPFPLNSYMVDRLLCSLYVDSSYIQKTLDWQPPFTLEQGLAQTIQPEN